MGVQDAFSGAVRAGDVAGVAGGAGNMLYPATV